jgi:hypothetical protein
MLKLNRNYSVKAERRSDIGPPVFGLVVHTTNPGENAGHNHSKNFFANRIKDSKAFTPSRLSSLLLLSKRESSVRHHVSRYGSNARQTCVQE